MGQKASTCSGCALSPPPAPQGPIPCILQPREHFSAPCQAPRRPGKRRVGDKEALEPPSGRSTQVCARGAQPQRERRERRGCCGQVPPTPWDNLVAVGSCSPYRPSSCHILAPWLVADEEESTEQTLSPSRMSHSCSSPRPQLAGPCPARPLVRIVLPH